MHCSIHLMSHVFLYYTMIQSVSRLIRFMLFVQPDGAYNYWVAVRQQLFSLAALILGYLLLSIGSSSPDETGIPAPSQPCPHSRTSSTSTSTILSIDSMAMHSWRPWAFMPPVDRLGQGSPM